MYKVSIMIEGIAPVLFNGWTERAREALEGPSGRGGRTTLADKRLEAREKAYRNKAGDYIIPGTMLKSCIINGAKMANLKSNRRSLATYLKGAIFIEDASLGKDDCDYLDERIIPTKNGADIQVRPAFTEGWTAHAEITVVDDAISWTDLETAIQTAGMYCGIGSHRPDFGRFTLEEVEEVETS